LAQQSHRRRLSPVHAYTIAFASIALFERHHLPRKTSETETLAITLPCVTKPKNALADAKALYGYIRT
jgi:hypothetical protein